MLAIKEIYKNLKLAVGFNLLHFQFTPASSNLAAKYLGVVGANGFLVDLKTTNPVKTENRAQAESIRQKWSLMLK